MDAELKLLADWLRIHYTVGGTVSFGPLYRKYPDPPALRRALEEGTEREGLAKRIAPGKIEGYTEEDACKDVLFCRDAGWTVIPFDSLLYPPALREIKDPPAVLFASGNTPLLRRERMAAVVGSRETTRQGERAAFLLGCGLSSAGVTVVSGGARGIDMAAGLGAEKCRGGTVAVLGEGPGGGRELPFSGSENAVLVTELFPGTPGSRFSYPKRNRIIAGMAAGTAVIEAGEKSGALITAEYCRKQGKHLFVPSAGIADSAGCAALLADGAVPVSSPRDCIDRLFPGPADAGDLFTALPLDSTAADGLMPSGEGSARRKSRTGPVRTEQNLPEEKKTGIPARLPEYLSDSARRVYAALTAEPAGADDIAFLAGLPAKEVLCAVTELELEELARVHSGNRISL